MYFDPVSATLIPRSRLEYCILDERKNSTNHGEYPSVHKQSPPLESVNLSYTSITDIVVPSIDSMAEEAALIKPPTSP